MSSGGKRRAAPASRRPRSGGRDGGRTLALAFGITLCVVAWGYLVYAAVDFGSTARAGQSSAWVFLALACLGAIACLFVGLMLVSRLGAALGLSRPATPAAGEAMDPESGASTPSDLPGRPVAAPPRVPAQPRAPRVKGGKRAAR